MASVTMEQIAERVGISRSSVSFVLNGQARKHGISPRLERRILRAARELNYRPSLLARSLASKRTMTLGLLMVDLSRSYNPILCDAVIARAEASAYQVVLHHHGNDPQRFRRAWRTLEGWRVDGVMLSPIVGMKGSPEHQLLRTARAPLVLVESDVGDPALNSVMPDVMRAVQMAVEQLVALGHRRIALLSGPREFLETQQRETAFGQAMREAGLPVLPHWVHPSVYGEDMSAGAARAVEVIFASPADAPTALVVVNKTRASGAMRALNARGLRVPGDVSCMLVSSGDPRDEGLICFSQVFLDFAQVGCVATEMLLAGNTTARRVLIAPTYRPGESVAPPLTS